MKVMYFMTCDVIVGRPDMSVEEAKELMRQHHVSGLPIVDENACVVGVFSQTDALKKKDGRYVRDLMTTPAVTLEEVAPVNEAAALMAAKDINRIPVLARGGWWAWSAGPISCVMWPRTMPGSIIRSRSGVD